MPRERNRLVLIRHMLIYGICSKYGRRPKHKRNQ